MTNRLSKGIAGCLPIAVAAIGITSASGAAIKGSNSLAKSSDANGKPAVFPVDSKPYGKSYARWSVLWWQWFLPLTGAEYLACTTEKSGPVVFLLAGPAECTATVLPGKALFFPIANADCSSLEPPPFHGDTPAERATCAADLISGAGTLNVKIDGANVVNPNSYQVVSPDFPFTVGPDNVFGIPCPANSAKGNDDVECSGKASANGYYLMVAPLPKGDHTLQITATGFGINTTYKLTVGH